MDSYWNNSLWLLWLGVASTLPTKIFKNLQRGGGVVWGLAMEIIEIMYCNTPFIPKDFSGYLPLPGKTYALYTDHSTWSSFLHCICGLSLFNAKSNQVYRYSWWIFSNFCTYPVTAQKSENRIERMWLCLFTLSLSPLSASASHLSHFWISYPAAAVQCTS